MIVYGDRYDKKRCSRKDYHKMFANASRTLGVSGYVWAQIQRIVDEERDLLERKTTVFWDQTPYQPPQN